MDRRPLKSRNWPIAQQAATLLARRGISPNSISLFGMACGIGAGFTFAMTAKFDGVALHLLWVVTALLMQLRLLANLLDGMVAIEQGKSSAVGELYNEFPDRVSDVCIMIGAGYALGGIPVLGYIAAILAVTTAYIRSAGKAATGVSDYRGPMGKPHRMAILTVFCIAAACIPRPWLLNPAALPPLAITLVLIIAGCFITCVRRTSSIAKALNEKQS